MRYCLYNIMCCYENKNDRNEPSQDLHFVLKSQILFLKKAFSSTTLLAAGCSTPENSSNSSLSLGTTHSLSKYLSRTSFGVFLCILCRLYIANALLIYFEEEEKKISILLRRLSTWTLESLCADTTVHSDYLPGYI